MHSNVVICEKKSLKVFDVSDLDDVTDVSGSLQLCDMNIESVAFMPRSDTLVACAVEQGTATVYTCENFGEDLQVTDTPLSGPVVGQVANGGTFRGRVTATQRCFVSHDGTCYVLNVGNQVLLWSSSNDSVESLVLPADMNEDCLAVLCQASPKESIIAVVYSQSPHTVHVYDLKTHQVTKRLSLNDQQEIQDFALMPSNGFLLTHHMGDQSKLAVWNVRTGRELHVASEEVSFVRVSQSNDRLVISQTVDNVGRLLLRSSDCKVSTTLDAGDAWSAVASRCDAEFSPDGTILVGVDIANQLCRIWSAGNGDVVKDVRMTYIQSPCMIGMPTNTHIALCDSRIMLVDVASGESQCVTPMTVIYDSQLSRLCVSPRGNVIAGTASPGCALVYKLHNFTTIKLKTTLQRIKSFRG